MLGRLTGAYTKEPDSAIGKLFRIYASAVWGVEDTLQMVSQWRDINQAQGRTLDRLGRNLGVIRDSLDDRFYRLLIKTKITALLSGGDVNTIINATSVLFGIAADQIKVDELYPAKCRVTLNKAALDPIYIQYASITVPVIKQIMAAGVSKEFYLHDDVKASGVLHSVACPRGGLRLTVLPYVAERQFEAALIESASDVRIGTRLKIYPKEDHQ